MMARSHESRAFRGTIGLAPLLLIVLFNWVAASDGESIPISAGRIRYFEPGQAPPYVILGVVHAFRRQNQLAHSIYEQTALEARVCGGNIIVNAIMGHDDPLHEGYTMWVLGLAARLSDSPAARDSLRVCENCLVSWQFDAAGAGITDSALMEELEERAFATSRLKLARNGYYLLRSPEELNGRADSIPLLSLMVRISRVPDSTSHDRISFAWRATRPQTGAVHSEFAHTLKVPRGRPFDYLGSDQQTTRNALTAVFSRLPSHYVDSDGDGVPDSRDLEPHTPLGYEVDYYGRTLDSDGDGKPNSIDAQPFTISLYRLMVGPDGIPIVPGDADYDGVPDAEDDCDTTNVRYVVDGHGCPVEDPDIIKWLLERRVLQERRILFETGEARLLPDSAARLDSLGEALSRLPEINFRIDGHCDDRGTPEANRILSEQRAESVVQYLLGKFSGLRREQFATHGYGEERPAAVGQTDDARKANRRVEISALNPEDAVRHVEGTRYLLRKEAVDGYQFEASTGG